MFGRSPTSEEEVVDLLGSEGFLGPRSRFIRKVLGKDAIRDLMLLYPEQPGLFEQALRWVVMEEADLLARTFLRGNPAALSVEQHALQRKIFGVMKDLSGKIEKNIGARGGRSL